MTRARHRSTVVWVAVATLLLAAGPVAAAGGPAAAAAATCPPVDLQVPTGSTPAARAQLSASYTAPWNNIAAVRDGASLFTGDFNDQVWATWADPRPSQEWLQYSWSGEATLTGASMSFWHNVESDTAGDAVAVPASWTLQAWDGAAWVDVALASGTSYGREKEAVNEVTFAAPVVTTRLRAVFDATTDGVTYAAVGVSEFAVAGEAPTPPTPQTLTSDHFAVTFDGASGGIFGLTNATDTPQCTNYVSNSQLHPEFDVDDSRWTGDVVLRADGAVQSTGASDDTRTVAQSADGVRVSYAGDSTNAAGLKGIDLAEDYRLTGDGGDTLDWSLSLTNTTDATMTLQDLSIPMLMNSWWNGGDQTGIYEQNVARHSFVAEDGSYAYWQRPNGEGPYLVMVPKKGTSLEFRDKARDGEGTFGEQDPSWEGLVSFAIHSEALQPERAGLIGGYLPATSATLDAGASAEYGFTFRWATDYDDLHRVLYDSGVVDAISLPGMVIPQDTHASLAVRALDGIDSVVGEDGKNIEVTARGTRNGYQLYDITLPTTGPNKVVVNYGGDGRTSVLQYNSIAPIEGLIDEHAAFLVANQQAVGTGHGYEGAFLQWDMSTQKQVSWYDYPGGGWKEWMAGGSDDLGLSPAAFLSEQNVINPDQAQVSALDYYIHNFIWGYMQTQTDSSGNRTYRIYHWYDGTDGSSPGTDDGLGTWRVMNYPHVWNTYLNMYRIATAYPTITTELTADEYLMRAYNTMKAYFEHPNVGVLDNASREMGSMGESTMPDVHDALVAEGHTAEADKLEGFIAAKADAMLSRDYPFASEMSIDTTAFEATYELAHRYGDDAMVRKVTQASLSARGLQPLWYYYGSDNRHMGESWWNLGYETQLGAWQQQEYLKNYDAAAQGIDPDEVMRSTYGAYLAGWSNINSGQISSATGNVGAASWQYQSQLGMGDSGWDFMPMLNGWWAWSGEADLGFWGGLRTASVNVVDDKVFGLYAYGGEVEDTGDALSIVPQDGVRQRATFYTLNKFGFELSGGQYSAARVSKDLSSLDLTVESALAGVAVPTVTATGVPAGEYDVLVDGVASGSASSVGGRLSAQLNGLSEGAHEVQIRLADATPTTQSTVVTRFVDADGSDIAASTTVAGTPGDAYQTQAAEVAGYRVTGTPDNANGVFPAAGESVEVRYVYERVVDGGSAGGGAGATPQGLALTGGTIAPALALVAALAIAVGVALRVLRRRRHSVER